MNCADSAATNVGALHQSGSFSNHAKIITALAEAKTLNGFRPFC
jgi:hypothetical protein